MKKIFYILASAIVALGAVACQNEVDENITPNATKEISFTVSFDESTRVEGTVDGKTANFAFEGNETLYVGEAALNNTAEAKEVFTADDTNKATLNGLLGQNVTATVNNEDNGLQFASAEFELAEENNVTLSLACPALYFTVPADIEVVLTVNEAEAEYTEGNYFVGIEGTTAAISYSIGDVKVKEVTLNDMANKVYNLASLDAPICDINGERGYFTVAAAMAAANDGDILNLYEGEYEIAAFNRQDETVNNITVVGAGAEKTTIYGPASNNALPDIYANGLNITFEKLTITTQSTSTYDNGIGGAASVTFNECTILKEFYCQSGAPHYFNKCTIDPQTSYLYTWNSDVTLVECNFPVSNGKALQVYSDGIYHKTTTITDCTFSTNVQANTGDGKPVTPIDMNVANGAKLTVVISGCTATGFPEGLNSGSTLWNNKCDMSNITLTIDGVKYVGTADQLNAAVATGDEKIYIAAEIDLANVSLSNYNGEIIGITKNAAISTRNFTPSSNEAYQLRQGDITFENLKVLLPTDVDWIKAGFVSDANIVFNKCDFEGQATLNANGNWTFNECNFVSTVEGKYASFVYGVNKAIFNTCSFRGVDRAAKVYGTGGDLDVEYNGCTFTSTTTNKAGIEIDATYATTTVAIDADCSQTNMNGLYNLEGSKGTVIAPIAKGVTYEGSVYTISTEAEAATVLTAVFGHIEENNPTEAVVNIAAGATVEWATGSGHGSTPLLSEECTTETLTIQGGEGAVLKATGSGVGDIRNAGGKLILKDITVVDESVSYNEGAWELTYLEFGYAAEESFEFENVTFQSGISLDNGTFNINECDFITNESSVYAVWVSAPNVTITNSTFTGTRGLKMHEAYGSDITTISITGSQFNNLTKKPGIAIGTLDATTNVTISGNTFNNCQAGDQGLYSYESDTDVTTFNFTCENNTIIFDGVKIIGETQYELSNKNGMLWFANEVNANGNSFSGKTVMLTAAIDLENASWTPVGQTGATQFMGTFDGDNKTISNLNIDATAQTGAYYSSGIFGWLNAATVKNVKVVGATVKGNHNVGVIAGYMETAGCTITGCSVEGATVECYHANDDACGDKAGVVVGHAGNTGVVVSNCTAKESTVTAGRDAGQIVGAAKEANVTGCSVENVTVAAWADNSSCTGANINNAIIGRVL